MISKLAEVGGRMTKLPKGVTTSSLRRRATPTIPFSRPMRDPQFTRPAGHGQADASNTHHRPATLMKIVACSA
jgi:hypothetical protein